jgi:hypothetical protein
MTIKIEEIAKAVEKGLSIKSFIAMKVIEDGCEYLFPKAYFNSNTEHIYISGKISEEGKKLLAEISGEPVKKGINYKTLHQELQNSLIASYGKKQKEGFGGVYFIPTVKELEEFLGRFWKAYPDYKETEKITKILKQHVEKCGKSGKFAPAVKYFIYKQGAGSQLAGAYEGFEEIEVKEERVEPQEIKNLF